MKTGLPTPIDGIVQGYRASQVVLTAVRLGIFETLGDRRMLVAHIASELGADTRGVRILCDALVALRLLQKSKEEYSNSPSARAWLLSTSPTSQCALILHNAALYERWGCLFDVVKTGKPVSQDFGDPRLRKGSSGFARAMADSAVIQAGQTAAKIDLRGARAMLDMGGGPGVYAIAFARRWPKLQVTVLDSVPTIAVARENIVRARLDHRIHTLAGDAFKSSLGGPYDFVLLSNVVHQYSPDANRRLMRRAADALSPGGQLAVKDFVLDAGRDGPVAASLFAINMLVNTPEGDCYTAAEIRAWMREVGLSWNGQVRLRSPSRLLLGRKPVAG